MSTKQPIHRLTLKGFKSIKELSKFELSRLNVLIGANNAGKSNFVSYFRMLSEMMNMQLQNWTRKQGGSDRIVSFGVKETQKMVVFLLLEKDCILMVHTMEKAGHLLVPDTQK